LLNLKIKILAINPIIIIIEVDMGLKIPEIKIPNRICKAAKYILDILTGDCRAKEFELSYLIKVFEFLGAQYDEPEGSILRFDVSVEGIFITIHKIHGKKKKLAKTVYLRNQNSPFNRNLRRTGTDLTKIIKDIVDSCKK